MQALLLSGGGMQRAPAQATLCPDCSGVSL